VLKGGLRGSALRFVKIVYDRKNQRRWVAVDSRTDQQLLRLHDRDQLMRTCGRLGWEVRQVEEPPGEAGS
jgi:hypothetical protein